MNATGIEETKSVNKLKLEIPLSTDKRGRLSAAATQLSWIVRNFFCSICESYLQEAPRRVEGYKVACAMVDSAEETNQITAEDASSLRSEIHSINEQIYPGSSRT